MLILDSNTISYYFRGDPAVVPRLQAIRPSDQAILVTRNVREFARVPGLQSLDWHAE